MNPPRIAFAIPSPPLREQWSELYREYAAFYKAPPPDFAIVWQWLLNGELSGVAAEDDSGRLCGIAHWQIILRPLHCKRMCYLHDLFVAPQMRGGGIGEQLILTASESAKAAGCELIRWATAADNCKAMRLYDRIAEKTSWILYERKTG